MYKLALIVGHNEERKGAHSPHLEMSEYPYWSKWAQDFVAAHDPEELGWEAKVFYRASSQGYGSQIRGVYAAVDAWGADATIELHFNAAADPDAYGCEMLSSGSRLSMALASRLQNLTLDYCYDGEIRTRANRGVKVLRKGERGFMSVNTSKAPSVLIEPFFGSNAQDCEQWDGAEFAAALTEAVDMAFRTDFPRKSLDDSRTMQAAKKQRATTSVGIGSTVAAGASAVVGALGDPETAVEAAQTASTLSDLLPWAGTALTAIAIGAFIYNRVQTEAIEDAREDDHARGLR